MSPCGKLGLPHNTDVSEQADPEQPLAESQVTAAKLSSDVALDVTQLCPPHPIGAHGASPYSRGGAIQGHEQQEASGSLWGPSLKIICH